MKKRWLPYVIFGLIFYLLFLIIEMPASWFAWGLNRYSGGTVRLDPIAGSLWRGNGKLVIYYPQTVPNDLGNIEWRINPFWLLTGQLQIHLSTESADGRINTALQIGKNQTQLRDTGISFSAQTVGSFYPSISLISPSGQVTARTDKLIIQKNSMEGTAELTWKNAGSALANVKPLGDYHMEITGEGKTANLKLSTLHGPLELTGQGQWHVQSGQYQLTGSAMCRERCDELESLLRLLGPAQENGNYRLTLNGRLSLN